MKTKLTLSALTLVVIMGWNSAYAYDDEPKTQASSLSNELSPEKDSLAVVDTLKQKVSEITDKDYNITGPLFVNTAGSGYYIKIGANNADFGHFYTDRPRFYFSKGITVNGSIQSYSTNDLILETYNSSNSIVMNSKLNAQNSIYIPTSKWFVLGNSLSDFGFAITYRADYNKRSYCDIGSDLFFRNSAGSCPLVLQSDGSVVMGINTRYSEGLYPVNGHKLVVNGSIQCEKVRVITDVPSADYVFSSDYRLHSLEEVENFIQENHHLPNIPTAQEFSENGYDIGTMDEMLLKKIEEQTLYIIELNKRIKQLENAIAEITK